MKFGVSHWIAPGAAAAAVVVFCSGAAVAPSFAAAAASPAAAKATASATQSNGAAGKVVFEEMCGACHDLTLTTDQRKSREGWQATVTRMVNSGAALTDDQAAQVVDYLAKTYAAS